MRMKTCILCGLPESYPGLSFDEKGVCSLCNAFPGEEKPYAGEEALKQDIVHTLHHASTDRPYDAAVALSGGRDSTYLLYYAKEVLGLRVLAVTLSHAFIPQETVDAISDACAALDVDLHVIANHALDHSSARCVRAWARKPEAATLVTFCTGCRYGIKRMIPSFCREEGIPLLLVGNTRMEQMTYRQDLLSANPRHPTALNKMTGYLGSLARNPGLLGSPACACVQAYEFAYPLTRRILRDRRVAVLAPFRDYFEPAEEDVAAALQRLGWRHGECFRSEWRADCYVNLLRQFFYQRLLGFNDLDVCYAEKLRTGKLDPLTARTRLAEENVFDEDMIADMLQYYFDLELKDVLSAAR